jgi:hypothetical protein
MVFVALLPVHRGNLRPIALPTSNLTVQFDASDASKIWKTVTPLSNPAWSNPASDGDECLIWQSTVPGPTSERTFCCDVGLGATTGTGAHFKGTGHALKASDLLFDGSNDRLVFYDRTANATQSLGTIISASAATILIAVQFHSSTHNLATGSNDALFIDTSGRFGIAVRRATTGPDTFRLQFYNTDTGGLDVVELTVLLNTSYVVCMRHDSTTVYGSINGGTEVTVASGPTSSFSGSGVRIGGDGAHFLGCSIGEILVYNACLSGVDLINAIEYLKKKWV